MDLNEKIITRAERKPFKEYIPVTIDIMAAKGCDGMILSLILDLYKNGIVKASLAGGSSTLGGEILYKRSFD